MFERIKTALVLVVVVLLCMFATQSPVPMLLLMLLTAMIGAEEWLKLMPKLAYPARFWLAAVVGVVFSLSVPIIWPLLWGVTALFWLLAIPAVRQYPKKTAWVSTQLLTVVGILLLSATTTAVFGMWQQSPWWLMYVFGLVWIADSGAYFAGRAFGKHKLAPAVSPAKTLEGLAGGLILTAFFGWLVGTYDLHLVGAQWFSFLLLSGITVFASVLGDLVESMLKRQAQIKDSGTLLPGHGGVLDRIDSLLAAAPIFAFGYWLLGGFA